jgi:hypothetical protein
VVVGGSTAKGARTGRSSKRRRRPPWGNILGRVPIERRGWLFDEIIELDDNPIREEQYERMLRLKRYYGIEGGEHDPPVGVAPASVDWRPWYELALAVASELDESLKVVDTEPRPRGKTARRWRGTDGSMLLRLVDAVRETRPKRSIPWCLQEMQKRSPGLAKIPLPQLVVRYHEAKKHFRATKQAPKQKHPS